MSTADHPIAERLERRVGGDARLLAVVMLLPLVDGIFPALVLSGAIDDPIGAIQVGLLVFGGSATLVVILAEMTGCRRERVAIVGLVGVPLVVLAVLTAALAPTLASLLDLVIFERFAALVILAIAAKTASARIGQWLPRPAIIVGLGALASLEPAGATLVVNGNVDVIANALLAALVGIGFALVVALAAPTLRATLHVDRVRFGSAIALALLPLSMLGLPYGYAPLIVLAIALVFAYQPTVVSTGDSVPRSGTTGSPGPMTDGGTTDSTIASDEATGRGAGGGNTNSNGDGRSNGRAPETATGAIDNADNDFGGVQEWP